jgi:proline dehydrogenase
MTAQPSDPTPPEDGARDGLSATPVFRKVILSATNNKTVAKGVRRYGMRFGAARFVAGETLDEAVAALKALNAQGLKCNTTILGEGVHDEATANRVVADYKVVLDRIAREGLNVNVALKLTHLGLDLGEETAYRNVEELVRYAANAGNFIRIDMEESARVDPTLRIYKRLREAGHDNTGTVLQSYLYRTMADLESLLPLTPNLRFVKGAYLEQPAIVYPSKREVDRSYVELVERSLTAGGFTAVATHDERIIEHVIAFAEKRAIDRDKFQFQMLYGIRSQLQLDLAKRGFSVLVATPFGPDWYFYLMRRLAERPANALFFAKNLIKR